MKNQKGYFYILTNIRNNVLYTGSTNNLSRRVREHKRGYVNGFTKTYWVNRLVYYEIYDTMKEARKREKTVKGWLRKRKIELISSSNSAWQDLTGDLQRDPSLRSG